MEHGGSEKEFANVSFDALEAKNFSYKNILNEGVTKANNFEAILAGGTFIGSGGGTFQKTQKKQMFTLGI